MKNEKQIMIFIHQGRVSLSGLLGVLGLSGLSGLSEGYQGGYLGLPVGRRITSL